ncbi:PREDICTED: uncharacterized protein LOC105568321, partial [Vollenhovia emeryi]|uniref:uncharacterized protein LOC105568321 n=1 Tax=Vollenhovia emeryi TaxID=411798 RepID=UPI0005F550E1
VPGDINPAIDRRRAIALKLKTRVQPFVLLVGPTVEEYEACYLIIDEVNACDNIFAGLYSDYERLKALKESEFYVAPISYVIGSHYRPRTQMNKTVMSHEFDTGQYIPITKVLKHFVELPGCFDAIVSNLEHLSKTDEPFSNVVQGEMWKEKVAKHFYGKTVLPLIFFFDDMDPDNITGSHAGHHKLGALYYSIACVPQDYASKLENIFLASLFLSDCKVHGNMNLFRPVIQELIHLEKNGLIVKTNSGEKQIYFSLCLLLGDNLGIHSICGLAEGFNANYPCRMCKHHRNEILSTTSLAVHKMRTMQNYAVDVLSQNLSMTGIKEKCVWDSIPSFSFVQSICFDIMHDLLEGVCGYDLSLILFDLICNKKYFSIETLNNRILYFDYGPVESGNAVPQITKEHLIAGKLKFSSSEMLCFVRHFGLMLGDLVPEDVESWHLYLKLKSIVDIVSTPYVNLRSLSYLSILISEQHEMYLTVFPNVTLKPKHHYMLHYPQVMRRVGPLWPICCLRWEAKHRPLKQAAHATNSRRNLPLTLAIKHQLNLCARFISQKPLGEKYCFGVKEEVSIRDSKNYQSFRDILPKDLDEIINVFSWIRIAGTIYKKEMCVAVTFHKDTGYPVFGRINLITYCKKSNAVYFLLCMFETVDFVEHLCSYEVIEGSSEWNFTKFDDLIVPTPSHCRVGARSPSSFITFRHAFV